MSTKEPLYNANLSAEWIDWVEEPNSDGSRESEIFPFMRTWIDNTKPTKVLDIGCGQGAAADLFPPIVQYCGVDESRHLIKRAKEIHSASQRRYVLGSAYDLPTGAGTFDSCISLWVWSHLADLETAAREMGRVLANGGAYCIVTASPYTYDVRKTFYSEYEEKNGFLVGTFDLGNEKYLTDTTLCLHSFEDMSSALQKAGLSVDLQSELHLLEEGEHGLYIALCGKKDSSS